MPLLKSWVGAARSARQHTEILPLKRQVEQAARLGFAGVSKG